MKTLKIGKHTVEIFDSIEDLPVIRYHKYQKYLLIDAGVGGDIAAFDQRLERARQFMVAGKLDKAQTELNNLRQTVYLIQLGLNPKHRAFAVLVTKIDGRECDDISDDGLAAVMETLSDAPNGVMTAHIDAVKKKIDGELNLYFPETFADSSVKEYYDLLRKRTLAVLQNIVDGLDNPDKTANVEKLTTALITYSNPQIFFGSESVEIQYERQFENLCLILSEQLHIRPKECTVLEFYNAFDFIKRRAREAERERKKANKGR